MGQKKLDAAIGSYDGPAPIHVEWKPYMIDPNTKTDGEEFEAYCTRRWGSSGWTHGLRRSGRKVGANFGNWSTWPNTLKAHQLIAYVTNPERRGAAEEDDKKPSTSECNAVIFDAMYERGENVSLVDTLVKIGTERLGVSEGEEAADLRNHLRDNVGAPDVMREISKGRRRYNISGVPFFVVGAEGEDGGYVDRPYGFSGAQDSNTFVDMFEELAEKLK